MVKSGTSPKIAQLRSMVVVTHSILAPAIAVADPVTSRGIACPAVPATSTATDVAVLATWPRIAQARRRNATTAVNLVT